LKYALAIVGVVLLVVGIAGAVVSYSNVTAAALNAAAVCINNPISAECFSATAAINSAWTTVILFALLGVLLTSYMGTQAQAVGQGRLYAGVLGRADRLVLLVLGGLVQLLAAPSGGVVWGYGPVLFQPLEWFLVLFAVLGHGTAIQRAVGIWRGFSAPR